MTSIFISHSKDDPNLRFFERAFSGARGVDARWMELEDISPPPWARIKDELILSRAVFVSLSEQLLGLGYSHTRNWIDFEVGLACMANKPTWVFEPANHRIEFTVPYCTHHVLYEPESLDHTKWLKTRLEEYHSLFGPINDQDLLVRCVKKECQLEFYQMNGEGSFPCPSCRTPLEWKTSARHIEPHMGMVDWND